MSGSQSVNGGLGVVDRVGVAAARRNLQAAVSAGDRDGLATADCGTRCAGKFSCSDDDIGAGRTGSCGLLVVAQDVAAGRTARGNPGFRGSAGVAGRQGIVATSAIDGDVERAATGCATHMVAHRVVEGFDGRFPTVEVGIVGSRGIGVVAVGIQHECAMCALNGIAHSSRSGKSKAASGGGGQFLVELDGGEDTIGIGDFTDLGTGRDTGVVVAGDRHADSDDAV